MIIKSTDWNRTCIYMYFSTRERERESEREREREREREKREKGEVEGRGEGAEGAGRLMHNLSRPEQEEGVSQLGLTGPEMEIARRNFIRPRTFSRTNRTFTLSSRVSRDIRCSGWVITI